MNRIILIGNGFDLAHDLKTKYEHFIDWFWEQEIKKIIWTVPKNAEQSCKYENDYFTITANSNYNFRNSNIKNFKELKEKIRITNQTYGSPTKVISFNITNKFLQQIQNNITIQNWVDIEEEYYNALKSIINKKIKLAGGVVYANIDELNTYFSQIKKELEKYLTTINHKLEEYRIDFPNKEMFEQIYSEEKEIDYFLFLNFNYTSTHKFYDYNERYVGRETSNISSIQIHGNLRDKNNPIIFGYGDELDDDYKIILKKNDNKLLDNIKSVKYAETDNYKRLLNFIESDKYQIFIIGHSCGNSDRTLLNTLFENKNCQSIKIFYREWYEKDINGKEIKKDNFSEIYRNIMRNFTKFAELRAKVDDKTNSKKIPQFPS